MFANRAVTLAKALLVIFGLGLIFSRGQDP